MPALDNTKIISKATNGAGFIPDVTQNAAITGCSSIPITKLLHKLVRTTVMSISIRQKVTEDIFWNIGPKIAFMNAEIPVDSFVSTLPSKIAEVHRKKVDHAKFAMTFPNGRTGVDLSLFKFTQASKAV